MLGHSQNRLAVAGGVVGAQRNFSKAKRFYDVPTRYREVVLTVSNNIA